MLRLTLPRGFDKSLLREPDRVLYLMRQIAADQERRRIEEIHKQIRDKELQRIRDSKYAEIHGIRP